MDSSGESAGPDMRRWERVTTRARASMTPGQRWTSGLILAVVVLVLAFGAPRAVTAIAEPSAGSVAPVVPPQVAAFPPTTEAPTPAPLPEPVASPSMVSAPVAEPSQPPAAAPPPPSPPRPAPAPGPCAIDTGLPAPVARTIVSVLAATQTTIAKATGQAPPDLASLLGSLAQCPPPT